VNYPANHPFSDRYVSQIPVTTSDLRSAAAKAYMARMQEEGKANASKQTFMPVTHAAAEKKRGHCPLCIKQMTRLNRTQRVVGGYRLYVCKTCSASIPVERGEAA
jgi:predicted SprT family Zn-dependent metalloprotease